MQRVSSEFRQQMSRGITTGGGGILTFTLEWTLQMLGHCYPCDTSTLAMPARAGKNCNIRLQLPILLYTVMNPRGLMLCSLRICQMTEAKYIGLALRKVTCTQQTAPPPSATHTLLSQLVAQLPIINFAQTLSHSSRPLQRNTVNLTILSFHFVKSSCTTRATD